MSKTGRRSFLIGASAVLLAGCSGSNESDDSSSNQGGGESEPDTPEPTPTPRPDSDGDGVPDIEDDFPEDSSYSTLIYEEADTRQVPEDNWYVEGFELSENATLIYQFIVRSGPAIDAILVDQSEYDQLEAGNRYQYSTEGSVLEDEGGGATTTLSPGSYYLVFDNSSIGEARPPTNFDDDIAEIEYEMILAQ